MIYGTRAEKFRGLMYMKFTDINAISFSMLLHELTNILKQKSENDVERMNSMLSEEFKSQGIKYIFSVGTMAEFMKSVSKRQKERSRSEKGILYR